MAGNIQPAPKAFVGAARQSGPASADRSAIERLSFELFGDLDGDEGAEVPARRQTTVEMPGGATAENSGSSVPFLLPAFNGFVALAAYDTSLRPPERTFPDSKAPADVGEQARGRAVYVQQSERLDAESSGGLVLDYRF